MEIGMVLVPIIAILALGIKWGLIILGIIWFVRYVKRSKEELLLLRLELGKLADEVQQIRQELKRPGESLETEANNNE